MLGFNDCAEASLAHWSCTLVQKVKVEKGALVSSVSIPNSSSHVLIMCPFANTMACHGNAVVLLRVTRPTELRRPLLSSDDGCHTNHAGSSAAARWKSAVDSPVSVWTFKAVGRGHTQCVCVCVCVCVPIYPLHGCPATVAPTSAPLSHPCNKVLRSPQQYFRSLATVRLLLSLRDTLAADDRELGCADSAEVGIA
jgi:hypothetical protein